MRKDGSRFFASVVIDPIYEDGKLIGFAKITRDITERQNAISELVQKRKPVQDAGRRRHRLRALHARSLRHRLQLEYRRRAHQGLHLGGDRRAAFFAFLHARGSGRRKARSSLEHRARKPAATMKKAGASARMDRFFGRASSSIPSAMTRAS